MRRDLKTKKIVTMSEADKMNEKSFKLRLNSKSKLRLLPALETDSELASPISVRNNTFILIYF
jgi:hypothetical protein